MSNTPDDQPQPADAIGAVDLVLIDEWHLSLHGPRALPHKRTAQLSATVTTALRQMTSALTTTLNVGTNCHTPQLVISPNGRPFDRAGSQEGEAPDGR